MNEAEVNRMRRFVRATKAAFPGYVGQDDDEYHLRLSVTPTGLVGRWQGVMWQAESAGALLDAAEAWLRSTMASGVQTRRDRLDKALEQQREVEKILGEP